MFISNTVTLKKSALPYQRLSVRQSEIIAANLRVYSGTDRDVALQRNALPLYRGWALTIAIQPDGNMIMWDDVGEPVYDPVETLFIRISLLRAADLHSELATLIPTRPDDAVMCDMCCGTGVIQERELAKLGIGCQCGGVGWLDPSETLAVRSSEDAIGQTSSPKGASSRSRRALVYFVFSLAGLIVGSYISVHVGNFWYPAEANGRVLPKLIATLISSPIAMTLGILPSLGTYGLGHGLAMLFGMTLTIFGTWKHFRSQRNYYVWLVFIGMILWSHNNFLAINALMSV